MVQLSRDGRMELPTSRKPVVFAIQTGEMLSDPPKLDDSLASYPLDPAAYARFCEELGKSGARNPNFNPGLPVAEPEPAARKPKAPRAVRPRHAAALPISTVTVTAHKNKVLAWHAALAILASFCATSSFLIYRTRRQAALRR